MTNFAGAVEDCRYRGQCAIGSETRWSGMAGAVKGMRGRDAVTVAEKGTRGLRAECKVRCTVVVGVRGLVNMDSVWFDLRGVKTVVV